MFMLPRLCESFGAGEKVVSAMLFVATISTLVCIDFSSHLSDVFGVGLVVVSKLLSFSWDRRHIGIAVRNVA